jgi:hypothetical protein
MNIDSYHLNANGNNLRDIKGSLSKEVSPQRNPLY